MFRFWVLTTTLFSLFGSGPGSAIAQESTKPDIVVFMVDDLDYRLYQHLLEQEKLPHIKKLFVDRGTSFEWSYVSNPICCPSRGTFLTGKYSHNHGAHAVMGPELFTFGLKYWLDQGNSKGSEQSTLPVWLQKSGYHTVHIGKYLNGYGWDSEESYIPPGYDDWKGLIDLGTYEMYNYKININGTVQKFGADTLDYQTDVLTAETIKSIRSQGNEKPRYLFIAPTAPHIEHRLWSDVVGQTARKFFPTIRPAPRHLKYVDGDITNGEMEDLPLVPSTNTSSLSGKYDYIQTQIPLDKYDLQDLGRHYKERAASMLAVDDMVGEIVAELESTRPGGDVVFMFTSDNGWFHGEHRLTQKALPYEEATRVPLMIAHTLGQQSTRAELVSNVDLAPTILELAGINPPGELDGRSLVPLLGKNAPVTWPRKRIFIEGYSVRSWNFFVNRPSFHLIRESGSQQLSHIKWLKGYIDKGDINTLDHSAAWTESYNLALDPYQLNPLALQAQSDIDGLMQDFFQCSGAKCLEIEEREIPELKYTTQVEAKSTMFKFAPFKFFTYLENQHPVLIVWVLWLILINSAAIVFIKHLEAKIVLLVWCINVPLMLGFFSVFGWSRILGLPHLIVWIPLIWWLQKRLKPYYLDNKFSIWLRATMVSIISSLCLDAIDVVRFLVEQSGLLG